MNIYIVPPYHRWYSTTNSNPNATHPPSLDRIPNTTLKFTLQYTHYYVRGGPSETQRYLGVLLPDARTPVTDGEEELGVDRVALQRHDGAVVATAAAGSRIVDENAVVLPLVLRVEACRWGGREMEARVGGVRWGCEMGV